jgi:Ni/Co efflux regulator RcnB
MRKIILTALGAALMAASTAQAAAAAQHHHARKVERAISAERFRNAHDAATSPAQPGWHYSGYSAPAGR